MRGNSHIKVEVVRGVAKLASLLLYLSFPTCGCLNALAAEEAAAVEENSASKTETKSAEQTTPDETSSVQSSEWKDSEKESTEQKAPNQKVTEQKSPENKTSGHAPIVHPTAAKRPTDLRSLVAMCAAIRFRIDRDHRIRMREEIYKGEKRVHIYLFMSEQPLPYVVSLGWFTAREETVHVEPEKKKGGLGNILKKPVTASLDKAKDLLGPKKYLVPVDELGMVLPPPGVEPADKNYDKAAWNAAIGFDKLGGKDIGAAEKDFNDAIKIAPINARFSNNLGAVLAARGEYTSATPHFDRAIRENDRFAAAYANRALLALATGHPQDALKDAIKATELDPTLTPGRVAHARALMEIGNTEEALKVSQSLKADTPAEWQSMLLYADVLLASKEYREAKATLARCSVLNPGSANIAVKLAHCYDKLGDLDEAIKYARKATQLAPNDPRAHITLARYLDSNRDVNAARLQFERAMDLKPDRSLRKTAMGAILRIMIATNKLPLADEASKKWVKQYSEDSECHYNRAWIASQLGNEYIQECIDEYRKALDQDPALTSVHYNLALVLMKAGKNQDALKELKTFVSACPDDTDSDSAKELIKKLEGNG